MTLSNFLKLVEIKTKAASILPFLIGSSFALYAFNTFDPINGILFFASMLIFDMTTTAINNYIDYKTAACKEGYGYEIHNAITYYHLDPHQVRNLILAMLTLSSLLGIILVLRTNLIVLLMGMACFAIGIAYTYGPLPISRTPFGELFSSLTMGLVLTFIAIYIHVYDQQLLTLTYTDSQLILTADLKELFVIGLVCLPMIGTIANIMLANNLCDMDEDQKNHRLTLPLWIGREKSLMLYKGLYLISFLGILAAISLNILPIYSLLTLLAAWPVFKNCRQFEAKQEKAATFVLSIKNFMLINCLYLATLIIGCITSL